MRLLARLLLPLLCVATLVMPVATAAQFVFHAAASADTQTLAPATATHCEHAAPATSEHDDPASANPAPSHGVCGACVGHCLPAMVAVLPHARFRGTALLPATASAGQAGITTLPELKPPRA